ncbi:bZIP transcription factor bZIP-1 [Penicillium angulare]|uniref:bZIP transcription factor bZIP-1 n=1 Tax=Penicillium angulare TaxID=116970 RepID=UPI0025412B86|nr:bZIP transcription factor bZIP-1 [Penicillium angulare]KAJ5279137.1 bZIP transcription factor bZIP-1 [Penicillium angulare]
MAACSCTSSAAISQVAFIYWQPQQRPTPLNQSFDTFAAQQSDLWTEPELSFSDIDWNFISTNHHHATPYSTAAGGLDMSVTDPYGVATAFASLSDSGSLEQQSQNTSSFIPSSANSQDGLSHSSPASQVPASVATSKSSPANSLGDDALGRVDSSRVEKRRLNTLAARRCRQRRVDQMKTLEDELELIRKERDELRLKVSKLEGETEALKGLLSRKSK